MTYLDRDHLNDLKKKLSVKQISLVELSYLFALLAFIGVSAPPAHPISHLLSITLRSSHIKHSRLATRLLQAAQCENIVTFDEECLMNNVTMTRCLALTVMSNYTIQMGDMENAWKYAELANQDAKTIKLFDVHIGEELHSPLHPGSAQKMSSRLIYRRGRLQADLIFNGRFTSFLLNRKTSIPNIDEKIHSKPRKQDGSIDHFKLQLLQVKTSGPLLGLCVTEFINNYDQYTCPNQRLMDALRLDKQLTILIESQPQDLLDDPDGSRVILQNGSSSRLADQLLTVAATCHLLRIILTTPFFTGISQDARLQRTGFHAARDILSYFSLM